MHCYTIRNALDEEVDEYLSYDYSARPLAIKAAIALSIETKMVFTVRNENTFFTWLVNGNDVVSCGRSHSQER